MMTTQQMSRAFASSSKSPFSAVPLKKYEVFLSFRGEDTRRNFTSHLYDALCRKKVETFIDYELEKGDEISPALIEAIKESHASIVIFSENYASSKWCLNELIKILECKKDRGQIVIPVFYNIDPSHVRKQTGSYQQAFANHEQDLKHDKEKLQKWKAALIEAADLNGWDSQNRIESDLVKDIVEDVLGKLKPRYPSYEVKGLVGVEEKFEQMESLLIIGSNDVRIIGIWGMGGMGKTTLATALYARHNSQFEGHCFLPNVREESNKYGLNVVRNKLFSTLLEDKNPCLDAPYVETTFLRRRLARKKVFIVLDDVATSKQIEDPIIDYNCLGPGSRVILTTRDKHVFSQFDECSIYEVNGLNKHDSLELFCSIVFREKHPKIGYEDLSTSVIAYCNGNPLALKVLGANLRSRSEEAWKSELKKLQKIPSGEIHNVLKWSYDDLDHTEKNIFLDIACFLNGKHIGLITSVLEACDFYATKGIEVLLDKALITISDSQNIGMHDLIQEMGREIVNQESKDPWKRSRLWRYEEVYDVLKNNKGTEVVEGIKLDIAKLGKALYLSPDSFKRMTNLRYLDIYDSNWIGTSSNVCFLDSLGWLSDRLRYLHWHAFSLESLPPSFCAEKLVVLSMRRSKLKKLWDGIQDLVNLTEICLDCSADLIEVPDLSRASNLKRVSLRYCASLRQLHPSILPLPKLTHLHLEGCTKMESLRTDIHSKSLRELDLSFCSSLTEFSVTSEEMTKLCLHYTAIHQLPSSTWRNNKLIDLTLSGCEDLHIVGKKLSNDPGLGSLTYLRIFGCKQINASNLWFILDGILSLKTLCVCNCDNLEALPDNIQNHSMLKHLELSNCGKLVSLPELPPSLLKFIDVNCTSLDTNQLPVLENMLQSKSYIQPPIDEDGDGKRYMHAFFCVPGAQVPGKFEFHMTTDTSITIPPIPKSDLCGFIFCTILADQGVNALYSHLECSICEHCKEVDSCSLILNYQPSFSDHVLLWWCGYNVQESGGDHYDLSFSFEFKYKGLFTVREYNGHYKERWLSYNYGIKGCGILPIYASEMDDSSSIEESSDESDQHLEIDIDDFQPP